jgi:hypothetical protein
MASSDLVDELAQGAVERLKQDLELVVGRLRGYLEQILKDTAHLDEEGRLVSDSWNAELAAKLEAEYSVILDGLGYDGALHTLLDTFEAVAEATGVQLQDRLGTSMSGAAQRSMAAFAEGAVDQLLLRRDEAGSRLRDILVVGATTNAPVDDLVYELALAAEVTTQQAVVEAQTQLMGFHRDALETDAEASGIDLFVYAGPDDGITRPFCSPLVGKIVTIQDLDEMDAGPSQPKPTSRFLGGYRCRHSLAPITLEEGQDMVRAGGADAIGPDCPLARRILLEGAAGPAQEAFSRGLGGLYRAAAG